MGVEAPIKHPRTPDAEQCVKMRQAIDRPTKPSWSDFTRDADVPLNGTFPYYSDGVPGESYGSGHYKATNGRLYKVSTSGAGTPLAWYPAPGLRGGDADNNGRLGAPVDVGNAGFSWSSTFSGTLGMTSGFSAPWLAPSSSGYRAHGFPLRCLSE